MKEINNAQVDIYQDKNNCPSVESINRLNEENKKPENELESKIKKDNENDNIKDDENEKLIKIIDDISIRLKDENNKKKKLEEI